MIDPGGDSAVTWCYSRALIGQLTWSVWSRDSSSTRRLDGLREDPVLVGYCIKCLIQSQSIMLPIEPEFVSRSLVRDLQARRLSEHPDNPYRQLIVNENIYLALGKWEVPFRAPLISIMRIVRMSVCLCVPEICLLNKRDGCDLMGTCDFFQNGFTAIGKA